MSGKAVIQLSQQLAIDPASQFFLRSFKDLQKKTRFISAKSFQLQKR